jgi:hypothetical protein
LKLNWKKFALVFLLCNAVLFISGCGSWVTAIQALMPAINVAVTAIFSLIAALEGKTVPASVTAFWQKLQADISTELTNVQAILSTISANASSTVLQQIEAVFQAITSNLNSILAGLNVTDNSTVTKITNLVEIAVAAVEAVLALIPLAMHASVLDDAQKLHADKAATSSINNTHKLLQSEYHSIVTTPTANGDVNLALAALPQTLP